jgi:hypothetical protein
MILLFIILSHKQIKMNKFAVLVSVICGATGKMTYEENPAALVSCYDYDEITGENVANAVTSLEASSTKTSGGTTYPQAYDITLSGSNL